MGETENCTDAQTQTQTQSSQIWIESQPMETIVWGRLYRKNKALKSLDLCKAKFSIGRAETNDVVIKTDANLKPEENIPNQILFRISKIHFTITRDLDGQFNPVYIQDLSRNGTFVNGEKIGINKKIILQNDDVISLTAAFYKAYVFKDLSPSEAINLPREITSKYYVSRRLGEGACGTVRLTYDCKTCDEYAMKHVKKNIFTETAKITNLNHPEKVLNEGKIMNAIEHPCVIKMVDIVDKPDSVYMILELMKGGDLLSRIMKHRRLSEEISKLFFYQMCHAVKYLHDKGITHRDLKPDNILLETLDDETLLKISDFGMSKVVQNDSVMRTICGTPLYVAPEVLLTGGRGSYTKKVDIWSLGVVLFTCLSGTLPFSDQYGSPAVEQIKSGKFNFNHTCWTKLSINVKLLIKEMLTVDPEERPSIEYVLNHNWLKDPLIIRKANCLMKTIPIDSDDENFLEPPKKRIRREEK